MTSTTQGSDRGAGDRAWRGAAGPDAARARRDEIAALVDRQDRVSVADLVARYGVIDA